MGFGAGEVHEVFYGRFLRARAEREGRGGGVGEEASGTEFVVRLGDVQFPFSGNDEFDGKVVEAGAFEVEVGVTEFLAGAYEREGV